MKTAKTKRMPLLYPVPETKRAGCGLYQAAKSIGRKEVMCPTFLFACNECQYYRGVEGQKFENDEHEAKRSLDRRGRPNKSGIDWTNPDSTWAEKLRRWRRMLSGQPEITWTAYVSYTEHRIANAIRKLYYHLRHSDAYQVELEAGASPFDIRRYFCGDPARAQDVLDNKWVMDRVLVGWRKNGEVARIELAPPKKRGRKRKIAAPQPVKHINNDSAPIGKLRRTV